MKRTIIFIIFLLIGGLVGIIFGITKPNVPIYIKGGIIGGAILLTSFIVNKIFYKNR